MCDGVELTGLSPRIDWIFLAATWKVLFLTLVTWNFKQICSASKMRIQLYKTKFQKVFILLVKNLDYVLPREKSCQIEGKIWIDYLMRRLWERRAWGSTPAQSTPRAVTLFATRPRGLVSEWRKGLTSWKQHTCTVDASCSDTVEGQDAEARWVTEKFVLSTVSDSWHAQVRCTVAQAAQQQGYWAVQASQLWLTASLSLANYDKAQSPRQFVWIIC